MSELRNEYKPLDIKPKTSELDSKSYNNSRLARPTNISDFPLLSRGRFNGQTPKFDFFEPRKLDNLTNKSSSPPFFIQRRSDNKHKLRLGTEQTPYRANKKTEHEKLVNLITVNRLTEENRSKSTINKMNNFTSKLREIVKPRNLPLSKQPPLSINALPRSKHNKQRSLAAVFKDRPIAFGVGLFTRIGGLGPDSNSSQRAQSHSKEYSDSHYNAISNKVKGHFGELGINMAGFATKKTGNLTGTPLSVDVYQKLPAEIQKTLKDIIKSGLYGDGQKEFTISNYAKLFVNGQHYTYTQPKLLRVRFQPNEISMLKDNVDGKKTLFIEPFYVLALFEQSPLTANFFDLKRLSSDSYWFKIRPYTREFLRAISEFWEICFYSTRKKKIVNSIQWHLDPNGEIIKGVLARENCLMLEDGRLIKDLSLIVNRSLKDMVMLDYKIHSFAMNLVSFSLIFCKKNRAMEFLLYIGVVMKRIMF